MLKKIETISFHKIPAKNRNKKIFNSKLSKKLKSKVKKF